MKKWLLPFLLLAAVAGVGYYTLYVDQPRPQEQAETKVKVLPFNPGQVTTVTVVARDPDKSYAMAREKANQPWVFQKPSPWPVDERALANLLQDLAGLEAKTVTGEGAGRADFGLAPAAWQLQLSQAGGQEYTLLIGDQSPVDADSYYAGVGGAAGIYTIPATMVNRLTQSDNYVKVDIFKPTAASWQQISYQEQGKEYSLQRQGEGWRYLGPGGEKNPEQAKAEAWLEDLQGTWGELAAGKTPAGEPAGRLLLRGEQGETIIDSYAGGLLDYRSPAGRAVYRLEPERWSKFIAELVDGFGGKA